MTYESFKTEYTNLFNASMGYDPRKHVGAAIFAEKMADLADAYPEFAAKIDEELESD